MNKTKYKDIKTHLAVFWSIFSGLYILLVSFAPIPELNVRLVDTIIGFILGTVLSTILNHFFGSVFKSEPPKSPTQPLQEQE